MLIKEPKERGKAPAMIVFCSFEQMQMVIEIGKKHGFMNNFPLIFIKNYSPQVLKANMRILGATEYAIVLFRDKLPKFNNNGKMVYNWMNWERESTVDKVHPTQKPIAVLKNLIRLFTDKGDTVIDPVAGSATTLRAAFELGRNAYGFEIKKEFCKLAREKILSSFHQEMFCETECVNHDTKIESEVLFDVSDN